MSKLHLTLIPAVMLVAALLLNPSPERHRDKIRSAIAERSELERFLGVGQITAFASQYHSLGVASYTTVGDKTISYGLFGMVFLAN